METLTVEITNNDAWKVLQTLHEKNLINIIAKPGPEYIIFPGKQLSIEEFKAIIKAAELSETISLKEAKLSWSRKRKELLKQSR